MKAWRLLGEYDSTTDTYTALAGGGGSSPYTPDFNGRLIGLRTVSNRDAATTLQDHVNFKLTCTKFLPNVIECGNQGSGLQTAPALQPAPEDWVVDQNVQAGIPITIEGRNIGADTQVTPSVLIYGLFDVAG